MTNAELSRQEMIPDFLGAFPRTVLGCVKTGKDIMVTFSLGADPRNGGNPSFFDVFLTDDQADGLIRALQSVRRLNNLQEGGEGGGRGCGGGKAEKEATDIEVAVCIPRARLAGSDSGHEVASLAYLFLIKLFEAGGEHNIRSDGSPVLVCNGHHAAQKMAEVVKAEWEKRLCPMEKA